MRQWHAVTPAPGPGLVADLVGALGTPDFARRLLDGLRAELPADSWSAYRLGAQPALLMSASIEAEDRTRACWSAYLSGPYRHDRSLTTHVTGGAGEDAALRLCHATASDMQPEHRARVYEAHGMAERVSVVRPEHDGSLLALNFYRHQGRRPYADAALQSLGEVATAVVALVDKQLALRTPPPSPRARLAARWPALTARELDVCERLLRGLSHDGVAADLGLSVTTVKTLRNRAFDRLGIHQRSQLFALAQGTQA